MEVLVAWSKVVAFWGLRSGLAPVVARLIVGVHGTAATGVGFSVLCNGVGQGPFGVGPAGNPTHRRSNDRSVSGGPEDTAAGKVGVEGSGAAPKGQSKTQRDLILEAVEALKAFLGQGVGTQVVDLIQEHIPPPLQVTLPRSPSESEQAQHLATLLGKKARLDKSIQEGEEKVSKARLAVAEDEDDLSILQQEMKGLVNQIDAHHRKMMLDGRGVRVGMMVWRVSLWRRRVVVRRLVFRRMVARGGRLARVGLAVV